MYLLLDDNDNTCNKTKKGTYMFTEAPIKLLLTLQMMSCPRTKDFSGLSWRTTSWRIKLSWDSCTMGNIWRLLEANVWGSSSIVQCVCFAPFMFCSETMAGARDAQCITCCHTCLYAFQPQCFWINWDWNWFWIHLVFLWWQAVCIENSCLIRGSKEGRNGALHITKTLMRPAEKSMHTILTENGRFK